VRTADQRQDLSSCLHAPNLVQKDRHPAQQLACTPHHNKTRVPVVATSTHVAPFRAGRPVIGAARHAVSRLATYCHECRPGFFFSVFFSSFFLPFDFGTM